MAQGTNARGRISQGWKQYLEAGMQVREMSRAQAQRLVGQLVREGHVAEERAKSYVEEILERSRRRTTELTELVRREVRSQLSSLGLATKDDLERLERKLTKAAARRPSPAAATRKTAGKAGSSGSTTT